MLLGLLSPLIELPFTLGRTELPLALGRSELPPRELPLPLEGVGLSPRGLARPPGLAGTPGVAVAALAVVACEVLSLM